MTNRARIHLANLNIWMRAHLPKALMDFILFGLKMAWAALYGGAMLAGLIITKILWQESWALPRYDALLLYAMGLQAVFVTLKLESWREVRVILIFHVTGTIMELFKTHMGSWSYPEDSWARIAGVPLFSGFMYGAVGSFMLRAIKGFGMRFSPYPPYWLSIALAVAIYINFFSHHYMPDLRYLLIFGTLALFYRTQIYFQPNQKIYWMPLPIAAGLTACFLWIAENVGTMTGSWLYAGQSGFDLVSLSKMGSWYLLLYVSFATVTIIDRNALDCQSKVKN